MESLNLGKSDIIHHVVKFGIDIYPTVEIPKDRTRLNMFYEEARARYPQLCDQLVASDTDFRISKEFRPQSTGAGPKLRINTFVLTNRGPVFAFPLRLPDPVGDTRLESDMLDAFNGLKTLFFSAVAERKLMKVGLVRDVLFDTGQASCERILSDRHEFAGAKLKEGKCLLAYLDDLCNIRLEFEPGQVMTTTKLPVGAVVTDRQSFGLRVVLDVTNHQLKPLEEDDIAQVIERASSLWPDELLKCF